MTFPLVTYVFWSLTAVGQLLLLSRWRKLPFGLNLYLSGQVLLTVIGIPASLISLDLFAKVWHFAALANDVLMAVVVFAILDLIRSRAREKYRKMMFLAVFALAALAAVIVLSRLPFQQIQGHPAEAEFTLAHIWWAWLNVLVASTPIFCLLSASPLNKRLVLLLGGTGLYLVFRAGAIDYLITTRFLHELSASLLSTLAYFFSLGLWFISSLSNVEPVPVRHAAGHSPWITSSL